MMDVMDDWTNAKYVLMEMEDGTVDVGFWNPEGVQRGMERWEEFKGIKVLNSTIVPLDAPFPDKTFRNAWKVNNGSIQVDMEKARAIQMDKIRDARNKALKVLDIETMKGLDVQAEKQVLRDLPNTFDLSTATTPDELKQLWPEGLE